MVHRHRHRSLAFGTPDLLAAVVPYGRWLNPNILTVPGAGVVFGAPLYIGLPMIVVLASFAIAFRRRGEILFAGAMASIAFILSLGSQLNVDGHATISLPFALMLTFP